MWVIPAHARPFGLALGLELNVQLQLYASLEEETLTASVGFDPKGVGHVAVVVLVDYQRKKAPCKQGAQGTQRFTLA